MGCILDAAHPVRFCPLVLIKTSPLQAVVQKTLRKLPMGQVAALEPVDGWRSTYPTPQLYITLQGPSE